MQTRLLLPSSLVLSLCLAAGTAFAQSAAAPAGPAKKELVAKLLKLQQPGIEGLARNLALQPAMRLQQQAGAVIQARVAPEKREALIKDLDGDFKKYADEAVPVVRDRAVKLAPTTMGKLLEDRFSEDELGQIIGMLESPVYAKYMQTSGELEKSLVEKLVADSRPAIDPKLKTLEASLNKRLAAAAGVPAGADGKPAAKPAK